MRRSLSRLLLTSSSGCRYTMVSLFPLVNDTILRCANSGHILCAKCLLDSMIAAIKRNPNSHPARYPGPARGRGRGRGRGINASQNLGRSSNNGITNWTVDSLTAAWYQYLEREYETQLALAEVPRESWDTMKLCDEKWPREENLIIKEEMKGLWNIEGKQFVVEGECPVSHVWLIIRNTTHRVI